jgi:hypothetical protein
MTGGRSPVGRLFAYDLGDEIDLGELLAVCAFRVDGDSPAVRWHGNRGVRGEVVSQRAKAGDQFGTLGGVPDADVRIA